MPYTPDVLLQKVGGDLELALELLDAYREDAPVRLASLADAVERGDAEEASRVAHSLKGMSGVVRAERVAELALGMEQAGRKGDVERLRQVLSIFAPMLEEVLADINAFMESKGQ